MAVDAVRSEPVSKGEFPLSGKNTGNFLKAWVTRGQFLQQKRVFVYVVRFWLDKEQGI
jgi:hypothetical protein